MRVFFGVVVSKVFKGCVANERPEILQDNDPLRGVYVSLRFTPSPSLPSIRLLYG